MFQQRFEDMEIMINELRNEIENIRTEKNELEKQIHIEAEVKKNLNYYYIFSIFLKVLFA